MAEPTGSAPLESFSKFTGLPVKELAKPKDALSSFSEFVGEPLQPEVKKSPYELSGLDLQARSIDLSNVYTDPIANYASYKVPLSPYADWNEIRAENQGIGQKLGYGALKMGATIVGAVAENTIGIIGGIGSMLAGGTYANNPVGRSVDSANAWMSENFPHYYTKAELNPERQASEALGTANFWTDKFANGLGYSLGSLATGWITGGAGLLGRGVNLAGKAMAAAGRAGQVGKLVSTGEAMKNVYAASKMIATGTKLTADIAKYGNIARTLNAAKTLEVGAMMSLAESSVEAREKSKQFIQERESEWLENNPGMSLEDMPASDRERINEEARAVENFTFGWNMPVLMTSNLLMFGNAARGVKIGERATAETVLDQAGKRVVSLPTTGVGRFLNRAQKYTAPIYENSLTEAFQEGAQFMIGETAIDYYKNKFDSGVEDMTGAAIRGLSKTFGTADGIESMLLGALIGGGMGATSTSFGAAAKQRAMVKANTEKLLAITNSETFLNMRKSFEQKKELAQFSAALKAANDLGNYKLANELRKNFMAQHAIMFDNLDAIDLAYEKLDDMAKMPEADFMDLNGYDKSKPLLEQSGGKTQSGIVEEWKGEMKKYSDMGKRLDNIIQFMSPNQSGLAKLTMSKEQKVQKAAQDLYNQRLKNILLTNMISMETRDEEINEAYEKLVSLSPALKNFDRNKLVTLIKRNKITADAQGNLVLPKSLVDVSVSDVEEQEKKEGEPKPDPTTEEAAKKKNIKENESLTGALRTAVEESETLDKLQKMDFDKALADFITGIYTRELASTAFDELIKSPEKREIVLAAKQAAEQRAKVAKSNKEADSIVDNADSTRELDELIDHENLSPEMKAKVRKKYKELKAIEDKYMKDYQDIPLEVLEELVADIESIEEESPAKAAALLAVLEAKKNESLEQKDIKEGELTPAEAAAKKEAEDALKKGFSEEADEKADPDLNGKVYENSFALLSTDGRTIRVNGTVYQNLNENPVDAIRYGYEWDMQSETPSGNVAGNVKARKDELDKLKESVSKTDDLTSIMDDIFKVLDEKKYEAWQETLDPKQLEDDLKNPLATVTSEEEVYNIVSKYLIPKFIDAELAALEGKVTTETETSVTVSQVILHNEQNQTVEFKDTVAKELAEIILMAYQSQGTIESLGLSEVELRKQIQSRLNALQNLSEALRSKAKYDPNIITDKALQKLMDSHRTHLLDILSVYNMAKEKFMRQGKTMAEMNQDPDVQRARTMYSTTLKAFQAITKDYFKRTQLSPVSEPTEDQGGQMSEEAENEIKNKIGEAELLIDLANETIIGLEQQIAALDASIKLGMASPVNGEKIEKLTKDLEAARAEREIQQGHKNKLTEEYEYRKSSQASKDVQDSQGASQLAQEQGSGTTNQGAVQVPEGETVDVNEVAPLLPEIIDNPVFIETGETQDIFNSKSFETEEEETPDDSDPEEDEGNIQFRKKTVHEEVKNSENQSSIALIKTQHEYTNGYDNILVDENGTPIPNSYYYGTNGKDGRQQFELKNGKWVPIQIFPELLTDSDIVENGAEVRFEVNPETEWWQKFVKNNPNVAESEYWKNIPIFVAVRTKDGFKRVGLLEGYNPSNPSRSMDRETIYNLWDNGKIPTTILTNKYVDSQNIANAADENGNVFFFDPVPVDEDGNILYTPTLLVARTYKKEPKWEVTNRGDVLKEDETIPGDLLSRLSTADLGKVAILVRTPNGDLSYIRATTKKMTEVGYNAVVEAITDDRAADVAEIVGFNEVAEAAIDDKNRDLIFEQVFGEKSDPEAPRGYTFWLPSAETYITISSDQLAIALTETDSFVKFQFVEAVRGEEGGLNFEPIEGRSDWTAHMGSIASAFKEAIMKRRYQVDIDLLTENPEYESKVTGLVYASYLEYLTHPDEISDMEKDQGHSGILSSDVYLNPKTFSPYFDVVMNFGEITDEKGFKAQAAENEKPTTSRTVTKAKITKQEPLVKEQEDYTNESDMDEEDNQVDSTNALLDDDEIGEVAKRIEEEEEEEEQEDTDSNSSSLEKAINRRRTKTVETEEEDEEVVVGKKIKSQGLSGTIAEVEEEKGDPMVEVLEDIRKNQYSEMGKDPVTGEETHYVINRENYDRASKMTSEPFTGTAETQKASSSAGKLVHSLVENLLMGKPATKPAGVSSVAYLDLITQARAIQSMLRERGETAIAVEMVVYNTDPNYPNIAGTFDILTKDRKGEYRIYDIKTLTASGLENYEETKYGRSKRDQHGAQLSVYAYMFNGHAIQNKISATVRKGSTLLIPLRYDDDGTILKVSNFVEKKFTLNLNFGDVLDKKVSFAYKEAKKSSDPAIANHSKKKSPVKKTEKTGQFKEVDDTKRKKGKITKVTKESLADAITSVEASNGSMTPSSGVEEKLADIKSMILMSGGMSDAQFIMMVEDHFEITLTEKEADEIQSAIIEQIC